MHQRFVTRYHLPKLCASAGVPLVCPHSLRGLNATLAIAAGAAPHSVAVALGHSSFATTARHYADSSTVANVSLRKVADGLGSGAQRPGLEQLAALLRDNLSEVELSVLPQKLAGWMHDPVSASDSVFPNVSQEILLSNFSTAELMAQSQVEPGVVEELLGIFP